MDQRKLVRYLATYNDISTCHYQRPRVSECASGSDCGGGEKTYSKEKEHDRECNEYEGQVQPAEAVEDGEEYDFYRERDEEESQHDDFCAWFRGVPAGGAVGRDGCFG